MNAIMKDDTRLYPLANQPLCSGFGQCHSDKDKTDRNGVFRKGKPYKRLSLNDVLRMVENPPSVAKESAQWIIFSNLLSRESEKQRKNGEYYAVWCDFDNHTDLNAIKAVLAKLVCFYIVYSSRSATIDKQKWRVILPLGYIATAIQWQQVTAIINDKFEAAGIKTDRVSERFNQLCYLPNKGDFYQFHIERDYDPLVWNTALADELIDKQAQAIAEQQRIEQLKEQSRLKASERMATGSLSPIDAYNAAYPIEQCLELYGYKRTGKKYLSPNSESGAAGVTIKDNKWFSSHSSDAGIGTPNKNGCSGDAFDLFTWYKHSGNRNAAIKAAGVMFTTPNGKTITEANQAAFLEQNTPGNHIPPPKPEALPDSESQSTYNDTLDSETHYCNVEFLQFVDDKHILKQLALAIAKATYLPPHTVFLMGLGVFASVACRHWCVEYKYGGSVLPIGLYIVAEQPSGTAKSRTLSTFQSPFYAAEKTVKNAAKERLSVLYAIDKKTIKPEEETEIQQLQKTLKTVLFATNTTSEALEQSLTHSGGYFSAVSSEQGLFNTILGYCYSDKASNNDLLLNGFCGDYMGSLRVSRDGYYGAVVGGAVMFAQSGGIENLLKASNGTGLAERFLLIAEKHNLGTRDFSQTAVINHDLVDQYNTLCEKFATYVIESPLEFSELSRLGICDTGWRLILDYRNSIEKHLADGGRYSHISIRGAAAKVDMQIMKMAGVLHLLDDYESKTTTIDLKHIKAAIGISNAMLEANLRLCKDKGIIGTKAEYTAILKMFEYDNKPKIERTIIQTKIQVTPFSNFTGNKSELVRSALKEMVDDGILQVTFLTPKSEKCKPIKAYVLA